MPKRKSFLILAAAVIALFLIVRHDPKPAKPAHTDARDRAEAPMSAAAPVESPDTLKPLNLSDSIVPVDTATIIGELTPEERAAPLPFRVGLRMHDLEGLRERIYKGEIISQEEMAEKYYPTQEEFDQVAVWLRSNGLKVQEPDITRLSVAAAQLNAKSAYVACSRGREQCTVFTPDEKMLLKRLGSGDRLAVLDISLAREKSQPHSATREASAVIEHRSQAWWRLAQERASEFTQRVKRSVGQAWQRGARELNEVLKMAYTHERVHGQRHERDTG